MKKFIKLRIVDIQGLEEEEEDNKKMGFSDEQPKKKKKSKKLKPIEGELLLAIDNIVNIVAINNEVQISTLTDTFTVMNDIKEIKKELGIK